MTTAIQTSPNFNALNIQGLKTKLLLARPQYIDKCKHRTNDLWCLWSKHKQQLFKMLWQAIQNKSVQQLCELQSLFIGANRSGSEPCFSDTFVSDTFDWGQTATFKACYINEALKEQLEVDWLIAIFNHTFADTKTQLERSEGEPEYFAATIDSNTGLAIPARITFAHGYFSSALHELHTTLYRLTC